MKESRRNADEDIKGHFLDLPMSHMLGDVLEPKSKIKIPADDHCVPISFRWGLVVPLLSWFVLGGRV